MDSEHKNIKRALKQGYVYILRKGSRGVYVKDMVSLSFLSGLTFDIKKQAYCIVDVRNGLKLFEKFYGSSPKMKYDTETPWSVRMDELLSHKQHLARYGR